MNHTSRDRSKPLWMEPERVQIEWWKQRAIDHSQRIAELTEMLGGGYRIPRKEEYQVSCCGCRGHSLRLCTKSPCDIPHPHHALACEVD